MLPGKCYILAKRKLQSDDQHELDCLSTNFVLSFFYKLNSVIMAALRSGCGHYIFALWFLSIFYLSFLFIA